MAVIGFLKHASKIREANDQSRVTVFSEAGKRFSTIRGAFKHRFRVSFPPMISPSDTHDDFLDAINTTRYLNSSFQSSLPGVITQHRGAWSGTPTMRVTATGGDTIMVQNTLSVAVTNYAVAGDYIQIGDDKKAYQVRENANADTSGHVTIKLNMPIVKQASATEVIKFGKAVEFNVVASEIPQATYTQRDDQTDIVRYKDILLLEVIE